MEKLIWLAARPSTQDTLLASVITERLGVQCTLLCQGEQSGAWPDVADDALVVFDVTGLGQEALLAGLDTVMLRWPQARFAVVNLPGDAVPDALALRSRLVGMFADQCSHDVLIKGLAGMLKGEFWLPRKVMENFFQRYRDKVGERTASEPEGALTPKELKTLQLIAEGKSNQEIAEQLFVSKHTVKTHIYNLFRKINVTSRSQAVLWAIRNLDVA